MTEEKKKPFNPNCDLCGKPVVNVNYLRREEKDAGYTMILKDGTQTERHYQCEVK